MLNGFWCETGQGGRLDADLHDIPCPNETRSVDTICRLCFRTDQLTCSFWCETGQGGRLEADSHDTLCPNETRSVDPCFERTSSRAASGVKAAKAEGSRPTHTTPSDSRRREIHQSHVIRLIHLEELHAITTDPRPARRNPHNQTGDCNSHQKEDERRRR